MKKRKSGIEEEQHIGVASWRKRHGIGGVIGIGNNRRQTWRKRQQPGRRRALALNALAHQAW